jgi:roadblock/LC7 domain-containing protein
VKNAKGEDVTPEYREKYKQIQARVAKLESELKKQKTTPEGKFDPNPELIGLRAEIQKQLVELRALNAAPANTPAKVQLQGKIGLTEEEFQTAKGDVARINAILEKKPGGRKNVLPANTPPGTLSSLEALNLKIGEALKVTLTTEQFSQTGGNEQAIRAKAQAVAALNERANTGLTAEEFQGVKGDLAKINDILEKKTRRKNFLPAGTDPKTLQSLDALNLKIRAALQSPAHKPDGEVKAAIQAERAAMSARETAAKPKSLQELIEEAGGEKAIIRLGFPAGDLEFLPDDDKLAFLKGEIDLETAKERAGL